MSDGALAAVGGEDLETETDSLVGLHHYFIAHKGFLWSFNAPPWNSWRIFETIWKDVKTFELDMSRKNFWW